eukprot:14931_1
MGNQTTGSLNCNNQPINRENWNMIKDSSYVQLDLAKQEFHDFVMKYSFENIPYSEYTFFKKHAIKTHLVCRLRPEFNQYVSSFGAAPQWVKLTEPEKKQHKKYENRTSSIYFCDITIRKNVKQNLIEEVSLYTCLKAIGINDMNSLGWITALTINDVPIPKLRYNVKNIAITMRKEYKRDVKLSAIMNRQVDEPQPIKNNDIQRPKRKSRKTYESLRNLCESDENDDDEYIPQQNKKQRLNC